MTTSTTHEYRCRIGFEHVKPDGESFRFEPGDVVAGLPDRVLRALAEADDPAVEATEPKPKRVAKKRGA